MHESSYVDVVFHFYLKIYPKIWIIPKLSQKFTVQVHINPKQEAELLKVKHFFVEVQDNLSVSIYLQQIS